MSGFDAVKIAEALKPSSISKTARRNRLIKAALSEVFGRENVSVKGDRGTAYGWVIITIYAEKPHEGECERICLACNDKRREIERKAWRILEETGLVEELNIYYDEMGNQRYECIIDVKLV
ncbi:MAG: hypothetical protein QXT26_08370 [Thermoproteota archaeon]